MKPVACIRLLPRMPTTAAWLALPLCALGLAIAAHSEEAPPDKARADALDALVARLDDEAFSVRQDAETALLAGGQAALAAVRTAVTQKGLSPDRRARLATLAARLEAVLAWERIAKPLRADFVTGKVKVKDALLAFEKEFGMAPGSFDEVSEREVDVTLAGTTWAGALTEIARQGNAVLLPGETDSTYFVRLVHPKVRSPYPYGITAFSADHGLVVQGVCEEFEIYDEDISKPAKLEVSRGFRISIEALTTDFFTQHFSRSLKGMVLTDASGRAHLIPDTASIFYVFQNRTILSQELLGVADEKPLELRGTMVWDWPVELHRYVFVPQERAGEVNLKGNRRVSVTVEKVGARFQVGIKERIEAKEKGPALTEGWFIPRDKDGHRIELEIAKFEGGGGTNENGYSAETEATWTLETRPAEIYYEYPVGFEKRELAFHLKGLTLPKPKPKAPAPEKP